MKDIISQLNDILSQWRDQFVFFEKEKVWLLFSENGEGELCLNEMDFCFAENLQLESVKYDIERISIRLNKNRIINIHMAWPEDKTPYVKSVFFGYYFLPPDHDRIVKKPSEG